jgi:hypothetical protein
MIEDEQFTQITDDDLLRMFREERDAEHWHLARIMILEIERRRIARCSIIESSPLPPEKVS